MSFSNILLQGDRNTGKTYLIRRIIEQYNNTLSMAGFFTEKTDEGIVLFRVWDNFELLDSGPVEIIYREKDRTVRQKVFERLGVWSIERAMEHSELMVFDELGRFEQTCEKFTAAVRSALAHATPVLGALKSEGNVFLESIRRREDVSLFTITTETRERVHREVVDGIEEILHDQ